jgi:hypothetical protein
MDVEVRFVEGCPNLPVTRQRLEVALDAVGRADVDVRLRAVSCRLYSTAEGVSGSSSVEQLITALANVDPK